MPVKFNVGTYQIGPADWLRAALDILCGADKATIIPASWQIDMDQFPKIRDLNLKGSWIHSDKFEDNYLSDRFRLQSWTYRLAKETKRTVF